MAISLKHAFASAKGDGADASFVQPSNWNAEHVITMATARLLGRTTAGTGAVQELDAATATTFLLSAIQAALALGALATLSSVDTGQITNKAVTNAKLADVATATFKGRTTAATGVPEDLTVAQATALLNALVGDSGAGGTKGLVPAPGAGDAAAGKYLKASGAFAAPPSPAPDVILEDQKPSGTDGGTFTSGADRTRTLNTEVRDPSNLCTLASNQFTLVAGTYYIEWDAPVCADNLLHQTLLYDITGGVELKRGAQMRIGRSNDQVALSNRSTGQHTITVGSANTFEIRHRGNNTTNTVGFGVAGSFGTEIYTVVKIWKLA